MDRASQQRSEGRTNMKTLRGQPLLSLEVVVVVVVVVLLVLWGCAIWATPSPGIPPASITRAPTVTSTITPSMTPSLTPDRRPSETPTTEPSATYTPSPVPSTSTPAPSEIPTIPILPPVAGGIPPAGFVFESATGPPIETEYPLLSQFLLALLAGSVAYPAC